MSRHWTTVAVALALLTRVTVGLAGEPRSLDDLTEEETKRPAEQWTPDQIRAMGWTPYDCFHGVAGHPRAPTGLRWPMNDPVGPAMGACVSYSFMPDGLPLEPGPPPEGPTTFFTLMPAGSPAAVTAATATWSVASDVHFTLVTDGGGAFDAPGPAGLSGNIRVTSGAIASAGVLAHAYLPPFPGGVSSPGDVHFNHAFSWSTATPTPVGSFDVETVALHELGHSLGLDHMGTVAGDVMFPSYTGVKRTLTAGDIGFMTTIYGPAGHAAACTGACCHSSMVCSDDTEATCLGLGFTWQGPGTACPTGSLVRTAMHASGPVTHWSDPTLDCFAITRRGEQGCIPDVAIDAWTTSEEKTQQTCHQFDAGLPESPPIPAGFFEQGSQPFEGQVCLIGEPLGFTNSGQYGEADTLILRSSDPFDKCELPDPAEERTVDIEIVALSLRSIEPITVMVDGEPTQWDMAVDLSTVPAPLGTLTARKEHCNGGVYNSVLPVQPRFTFTKVAGPGLPAGETVVLDTGDPQFALPPVVLLQTDNPPWSHDLDPYLNLASGGEGCSGFHPGVEDADPQPGCDCNGNSIRDDCDIDDCDGSAACSDCNANGIPDECDPDLDGDGIPDDCDNCPDTPNALQADLNGNGTGDLCEPGTIPTVSEWGLMVMTVLVLTVGTVVFGRRRRPAAG